MAKPTMPTNIGSTTTDIKMTLEQYLEYLLFLVSRNTNGIELETLLLAVINERCPDALNTILRMAKEGISIPHPTLTTGSVVLYKTEAMGDETTGTVIRYMPLTRAIMLEDSLIISMDDITQIVS